VPSGGRQAIGGKIIKIDDKRPHTGVQIIHFMLENIQKHRTCTKYYFYISKQSSPFSGEDV
jgi:hypothetical protein